MSAERCAREYARNLLKEERDRFATSLREKSVEGLCYEWLRTVPVTKTFADSRAAFETFLRTYYMPFVHDNATSGERFMELMASYMDDNVKKTRIVYDTFHTALTEYCYTVVGALVGGTRDGVPILFSTNADDTWWHYDAFSPRKHEPLRDALETSAGIWSGATRCPANRPGAAPAAEKLLRRDVSEEMQRLLTLHHTYEVALASLGTEIPGVEKRMRLEYWGNESTVVRELRVALEAETARATTHADSVAALERANERQLDQSEATIRELENDAAYWQRRATDAEARCRRLMARLRRPPPPPMPAYYPPPQGPPGYFPPAPFDLKRPRLNPY
jgi:hypothetical protein|tara:strand:- start:4944 stop:5942 length:999 start_codon:yes stop_codon:yes gene_type:complete